MVKAKFYKVWGRTSTTL